MQRLVAISMLACSLAAEHIDFEAMDLNRDGVLDRAEVEAARLAAQRQPSSPAGPTRLEPNSGPALQQRAVTSVFVDGFHGYRVFRIPAVVQHEGTVLAFAEARRQGPDQDHIDIFVRRSRDEGRTWEEPTLAAGDPSDLRATATGNPTPIVDRKAGKVLLVYCVNDTWVFQTETADLGATWSRPRNITHMVKRPGWGWMATGPSHGLATQSGRLIVPFNTFLAEKKVVTEVVETGCAGTAECRAYHPDGTLTLKYSIRNTADDQDVVLTGTLNGTTAPPSFTWAGDRSGVLYSDDHGATWHIGGQILDYVSSSENTVEELIVDNRSELLMSFRVESPDTRCRKMAKSRDGGASFQPYFEPVSQRGGCIPDPVCQGSILSLLGGEVLLTSSPYSKTGRVDMSIHISLDGGNTFALLSRLMEGSAGYSDLVFLGGDADRLRAGVLFEGNGGLFFVAFDVVDKSSDALARITI